jgi:hypothetical protein
LYKEFEVDKNSAVMQSPCLAPKIKISSEEFIMAKLIVFEVQNHFS